jgi:hypothetical protein
MTELQERIVREREEIAARVARFRATQEKFQREREEFVSHTWQNIRKGDALVLIERNQTSKNETNEKPGDEPGFSLSTTNCGSNDGSGDSRPGRRKPGRHNRRTVPPRRHRPADRNSRSSQARSNRGSLPQARPR